ncbi:MAG TPA: CRTAC1 family protein [Allocoleopsis sp.]
MLDNPTQMNYGIAVTDVDGDGSFELFVAGFNGPNLVLKYNGEGFVNIADETLADVGRRAIAVAAGDIDGDGREEIYVLNTDTLAGRKQFGDRLFDYPKGKWVDLFSLPKNRDALNLTAGRSVICVDRKGTGQYGFFVANYGGPMRLYELNDKGRLLDVAAEAGLDLTTGGRSVISLPLVSNHMDIFAVNEHGRNFLFCNQGDGTFKEIAEIAGIDDPDENGRGLVALDADGDGRFDLVYGNWLGPHRMYLQGVPGHFKDVAPPDMAIPSPIRTVIAADFDNDGYEELFFNNIGEPNRLFAYRDGTWKAIDTGDAWEPDGAGTGAAVGDLDEDGKLELFITHGEAAVQPISLYTSPENNNAWLRVLPLTERGAPARGASVTLVGEERTQKRVIDAGSGYLCQMEPVAHFGLGENPVIKQIEIRWPDGATIKISSPKANQLIRVPHPSS